MEENLSQKAIDLAIKCNWDEAIKVNLLIIKNDPEDIDALNRLSRAYFEKGDISKARRASKQVLKISFSNKIAANALERYGQESTNSNKKTNLNLSHFDFIEESGRTKLTTLVNLGSEKICSQLTTGEEVLFSPHAHKVSVTRMSGEYIGKLTDDLSARLRLYIKQGTKYKVIIKSVSKNCVKIFIKGDTISFPRETLESFGESGS